MTVFSTGSWLALLAGAATLAFGVAKAQSPETTQGAPTAGEAVASDTIVVTGFRGSLANARDAKRSANVFQDSLVAEDIGKFPDLNLAEALQRLPGVAITREAGEGRRINLRGLGSDFTRVKLNGMEALGNVDSANDSRGQATRDRAFDFNLFASELFTRVDVEKSLFAAQDEGGLAGTVNLYTAKPFDYDGLQYAASFQGGTNTGTEDFQDRYVGLISNTWNDQFGALLSVAFTRRQTEEQGYNVYRWRRVGLNDFQPQGTVLPPDISRLSAADQALLRSGQTYWSRGNRYSNWEGEQERLGVTGALQWKPTENLEFTLDGLFGQYKSDRDELHIHVRGTVAAEVALTNSSDFVIRNGVRTQVGPSRVNSFIVNANNEVIYSDVSNTNIGTETRVQETQNQFSQVVLSGKWEPTDRLTVTGLIGRQYSDYEIPIADKFYAETAGGIITDYRADPFYARNTYDFNTADPNVYWANEFDFREDYQTSELSTIKVDATWAIFDADAIRFGIAQRFFKNDGYRNSLDNLLLNEFRAGTVSNSIAPYAYVYDGHDAQRWVRVDFGRALAAYGINRDAVVPNNRQNDFAVKERTDTAYVQYDFDRDLGDMRLRGNAGVRWYETTQSSIGFLAGRKQVQTSSYDGVLPSANVAIEFNENLLLRGAYAQNINRVGLGTLRLNGTASQARGVITVSAGNPDLQPYTSDNFDFALEYYFGDIGQVSLGYFHKYIEGFPGTDTVNNVPYGSLGLPLDAIPGVTLTPTTNVDTFTRPINLRDFDLSGWELAFQSDLWFLPKPFDSFGVVGNVTLVDSELDYASPAQERDTVGIVNSIVRPLEGLSDTSWNFTLYYERETWGARVSANYRSEWLNRAGLATYNVPGEAALPGVTQRIEDDRNGWLETTYVDAAAFYQLNDHIRFTFDAINITDEREVQFVNSTKRVHNTLISSPTYLVGVSYKR